VKAFKEALLEQKMRSRNARTKFKGMKAQDEAFLNFNDASEFIGYDHLQVETKVIKVFDQGIVLEQTPFYATSGGQEADQGTINGMKVTDVSKLPHGQFLHQVEGEFEEGDEVLAIVDAKSRLDVIRNHSAAHLFHQAIKDILGKHANQQGQLVSNKSWRFDFNHFETENDDKILEIEKLVRYYISEKPLDVIIKEMPIAEAKKIGAMALFGEKYGDVVRVVNMGWSIELCGGTHVKNTKDIVDFAICSYESIGSGIYRMEGITGPHLEDKIQDFIKNYMDEIELLNQKVNRLDSKLKLPSAPKLLGSYQDIVNYRNYVASLKELIKEHEKQIEKDKQKNALSQIDDLIDQSLKNQIVVTHHLDNKVLKQLVDMIVDKTKADTIFLINLLDDKANFICKSSTNKASEYIKLAASISGGSGGGRPNIAQGGTSNLDKIDEVIKQIGDLL
jgi:alanyl-tRNA synthetase